jgi:hypothetical protein
LQTLLQTTLTSQRYFENKTKNCAKMNRKTVVVLLIEMLMLSWAWYLPGMAPKSYIPEEPVPVKVNKLTSVHTQLPYKYYWLPFCKPVCLILIQNFGYFHLTSFLI